jgi:hypothetical protein
MDEGDQVMSQQEFVSPSQSQQSQEEYAFNGEEAYNPQHPYSWSPNKAGVPRDEPPSSYDEPIIQRGYQAQDQRTDHKSQENIIGRSGKRTRRQQAQRTSRPLNPDGDAYERGYGMPQQYQAWQGVPPWARAQPRQKNLTRMIVLIVLGLIFIGPILHLLGGLLLFAIGAVFFALILAFFVLIIVGIFFLIFRLPLRRRSSFPPWRGPWGW